VPVAPPPPIERDRLFVPPPSDTPPATLPHAIAAAPLPARAVASEPRDSFELQLGTYWLARIGIVILLTGLVFLGNYAYQNWIATLGAAGKLAMLYVAGSGLGGLGLWLERKQESLKNYARVLMAGGAATIYYATYASHYVERLRVIESPLIAGALLLALAGGIVWFAERKRSETIAVLAVLLAYYTSAINPIGSFTLFSSLLLAGTAVWFLVRHGWATLSFTSLVATYASYGFWRFQAEPGPSASDVTFGLGLSFLLGYWSLFTAAVFLGKSTALPPERRAPFLTLNNAAFFALGGLHFAAHRPGSFWLFALCLGIALLGLAALASRWRAEDRLTDGAYIAQGLALITVGLAAKLTGQQLALTLAAQSAVLLTCSGFRHGLLYRIAAGLAAIGAFTMAVVQIGGSPHLALPLGGTIAAILLFDAWWVKKQRGELAALQFSPQAAGFALLGLWLTGTVLVEKVPAQWLPAAFAVTAVICATAVYLHRLPEIALPGQLFLATGAGLWLVRHWDVAPDSGSATVVLLIGALGLCHWWQRQPWLTLEREAARGLQIGCAAAFVAVLAVWLSHLFPGDAWLIVTAIAAVATLLYGGFTRAWAVALMGQVFSVLSVGAFLSDVFTGHPAWSAALAPVLALTAIAALVEPGSKRWWRCDGEALPLIEVARLYRWSAAALLGISAVEYVPAEWLTPFFSGCAAVLILAGAAPHHRERVRLGVIYGIAAFAIFWIRMASPVTWWQLLALVLIPGALRLGQRLAGEALLVSPRSRDAMVGAATASIWLWVTLWTLADGGAVNLTVAWSILALVVFAAGLGLRDRIYRLGGFAILALAIGRVFLIDVWQLETIYRVLSFLVLGAVLLLLSFVYNRLAETFRRWL
jgi:uncharacterized membrane protein